MSLHVASELPTTILDESANWEKMIEFPPIGVGVFPLETIQERKNALALLGSQNAKTDRRLA
jgi:hypothetical protein